MLTGDGAYIKKINRSIILQKIMEGEFISRADLAKITGLNKATVSVQVADLLNENLIIETQQEHTGIGRRPIMLSINEDAGYILGIDLDYKEIQFAVSNLKGNIVENKVIYPETEDYQEIVRLLTTEVKAFKSKYSSSGYGLTDAVIGIHGTVNKDGEIYFIPKYKWRNKRLKHDLRKNIDLNISIQNNANLTAIAESVYQYHYSTNLMTIVLKSGIGSGAMINGDLMKGFHGYSGELGHMIVQPGGIECNCGNKGCWELYASESKLFKRLEDSLGYPLHSYNEIKLLIDKGNQVTLTILEDFLYYVAIGLNNIINLYNPETLILNSRILEIYPDAISIIKENLHSNVSKYEEIALSTLGNRAGMMGACAFGIQKFLGFQELSLQTDSSFSQTTEGIS